MLLRAACVISASLFLGAAGAEDLSIQVTDVAPLAAQSEPVPAPAKKLTFQNTMYQAAPMPDEDSAPPAEAVRTEAELAPKMLSPRTLFQGDGYSNGSSSEASLSNRKSAAAGLGLSVPVN